MIWLGIFASLVLWFLWKLRPSRISDEVKVIGEDMITNHEKWNQGDHYFYNGKIKIWTANGITSINLYPKGDGVAGFNLAEKAYLNKCINKSMLLKAVKQL